MARSVAVLDHKRMFPVRGGQGSCDPYGMHEVKEGIITTLVVIFSIGYCALCLVALTLLSV